MSRPEDRAPRSVLLAFAGTVAGAVGFALSYSLGLGTEAMGATLGGALLCLAVGLALWSQRIDAAEPEYVEERALGPAPERDYAAFKQALTEQPVPRSGVLWSMLGVAAASLGGAALFPLRSLYKPQHGDPDAVLTHTEWRPSRHLVDEAGQRVRPEDLTLHSVLTVFPEGLDPAEHVDTTTLLVRVDPAELRLPTGRETWVVDGVVAYSKLCTHAGCPVGLYADSYRQLLCPCHHSIFDVLTGAEPIEGPAAHPLPQLPLGTDSEGYLVAEGGFSAPPAAAWWRYPE